MIREFGLIDVLYLLAAVRWTVLRRELPDVNQSGLFWVLLVVGLVTVPLAGPAAADATPDPPGAVGEERGALGVVTGFLILSFYAVFGGWTLGYAVHTIRAGLPGADRAAVHAGWKRREQMERPLVQRERFALLCIDARERLADDRIQFRIAVASYQCRRLHRLRTTMRLRLQSDLTRA